MKVQATNSAIIRVQVLFKPLPGDSTSRMLTEFTVSDGTHTLSVAWNGGSMVNVRYITAGTSSPIIYPAEVSTPNLKFYWKGEVAMITDGEGTTWAGSGSNTAGLLMIVSVEIGSATAHTGLFGNFNGNANDDQQSIDPTQQCTAMKNAFGINPTTDTVNLVSYDGAADLNATSAGCKINVKSTKVAFSEINTPVGKSMTLMSYVRVLQSSSSPSVVLAIELGTTHVIQVTIQDGKIRLVIDQTQETLPKTFTTNSWYTVAVVWDDSLSLGSLKLIINDGTTTLEATRNNIYTGETLGVKNLYVGQDTSSLPVEVDYIKMAAGALTSQQILTSMSNYSKEDDALFTVKFDECGHSDPVLNYRDPSSQQTSAITGEITPRPTATAPSTLPGDKGKSLILNGSATTEFNNLNVDPVSEFTTSVTVKPSQVGGGNTVVTVGDSDTVKVVMTGGGYKLVSQPSGGGTPVESSPVPYSGSDTTNGVSVGVAWSKDTGTAILTVIDPVTKEVVGTTTITGVNTGNNFDVSKVKLGDTNNNVSIEVGDVLITKKKLTPDEQVGNIGKEIDNINTPDLGAKVNFEDTDNKGDPVAVVYKGNNVTTVTGNMHPPTPTSDVSNAPVKVEEDVSRDTPTGNTVISVGSSQQCDNTYNTDIKPKCPSDSQKKSFTDFCIDDPSQASIYAEAAIKSCSVESSVPPQVVTSTSQGGTIGSTGGTTTGSSVAVAKGTTYTTFDGATVMNQTDTGPYTFVKVKNETTSKTTEVVLVYGPTNKNDPFTREIAGVGVQDGTTGISVTKDASGQLTVTITDKTTNTKTSLPYPDIGTHGGFEIDRTKTTVTITGPDGVKTKVSVDVTGEVSAKVELPETAKTGNDVTVSGIGGNNDGQALNDINKGVKTSDGQTQEVNDQYFKDNVLTEQYISDTNKQENKIDPSSSSLDYLDVDKDTLHSTPGAGTAVAISGGSQLKYNVSTTDYKPTNELTVITQLKPINASTTPTDITTLNTDKGTITLVQEGDKMYAKTVANDGTTKSTSKVSIPVGSDKNYSVVSVSKTSSGEVTVSISDPSTGQTVTSQTPITNVFGNENITITGGSFGDPKTTPSTGGTTKMDGFIVLDKVLTNEEVKKTAKESTDPSKTPDGVVLKGRKFFLCLSV